MMTLESVFGLQLAELHPNRRQVCIRPPQVVLQLAIRCGPDEAREGNAAHPDGKDDPIAAASLRCSEIPDFRTAGSTCSTIHYS